MVYVKNETRILQFRNNKVIFRIYLITHNMSKRKTPPQKKGPAPPRPGCSFAETHPAILERWDDEKNGTITPWDFSAGSHIKIWLKCHVNERHLVQVSPDYYAKYPKCCQYCNKRLTLPETSLQGLYPKLVEEEWDFEKNKQDPSTLSPGNRSKVWWKCKNGHSYQKSLEMKIRTMNSKKELCYECRLFINVAHPSVIEQWDVEGNKGVKLEELLKSSTVKYRWICGKCKGVSLVSIEHKLRALPENCYACNTKYRVTDENSFVKNAPKYLIDEYDPENDMDINELTTGSSYRAKWKCKNGHKYAAMIYNRTTKHFGCGQCKMTAGEQRVSKVLEALGVYYEIQAIFPDCKNKLPLHFDFIVYKHKEFQSLALDDICLIEYDGEQHFRPVERFRGEEGFKHTQKLDEIKNKYCEENDIKLLRVNQKSNIDQEIKDFLEEWIL